MNHIKVINPKLLEVEFIGTVYRGLTVKCQEWKFKLSHPSFQCLLNASEHWKTLSSYSGPSGSG